MGVQVRYLEGRCPLDCWLRCCLALAIEEACVRGQAPPALPLDKAYQKSIAYPAIILCTLRSMDNPRCTLGWPLLAWILGLIFFLFSEQVCNSFGGVP